MNRDILFALLGAAAMFLILKLLSSRGIAGGDTSKAAIDLLKTQQAMNLILTNEFRELAKTAQFKTLVATLAANELNVLQSAMTTKQF